MLAVYRRGQAQVAAFGREAHPDADENESGYGFQTSTDPIAPQHITDSRYDQRRAA